MPAIHSLWTFIIRQVRLYLLAGLLVGVMFGLLFAGLGREISADSDVVRLDTELANTLYERDWPAVVSVFRIITLFGNEVLYVLGIAVGVVLLRRRARVLCLLWIIAVLGGHFVNRMLKEFYARPRPVFEEPLSFEGTFSYPSGHAMASFIAYGMLAYLLWPSLRRPWQRALLVIGVVLLVGLIGLSRMILGVHYLSDVIGGYAGGAVWLAICITAAEAFRWRNQLAAAGAPMQEQVS